VFTPFPRPRRLHPRHTAPGRCRPSSASTRCTACVHQPYGSRSPHNACRSRARCPSRSLRQRPRAFALLTPPTPAASCSCAPCTLYMHTICHDTARSGPEAIPFCKLLVILYLAWTMVIGALEEFRLFYVLSTFFVAHNPTISSKSNAYMLLGYDTFCRQIDNLCRPGRTDQMGATAISTTYGDTLPRNAGIWCAYKRGVGTPGGTPADGPRGKPAGTGNETTDQPKGQARAPGTKERKGKRGASPDTTPHLQRTGHDSPDAAPSGTQAESRACRDSTDGPGSGCVRWRVIPVDARRNGDNSHDR
jgi:hypothetical protein